MRVRYTVRADADLEEILLYLHKRSPRGAVNVLSRIESVVARLTDQLQSGQTTSRSSVRVCVVGRYPYKVFYRVARDEIQIIHVRHTSRLPWDEDAE